MVYRISRPDKKLNGSIALTASKSESNRALIIQALCEEKFGISNLASAEDTQILQKILKNGSFKEGASNNFDVGPAGTSMRFLCAFLATRPGVHILTGSDRMKNRPIGILVDALRQLGAQIAYLENEGFAPLKITGTKLKGGEIEMDGSVSSQFVSALLLISTEMQNGLVIRFKGDVTSRPYINMTLKMLEEFRVYGQWQENAISVSKQSYHRKSEEGYSYHVEADWSAASYWYAMAALSAEAELEIKGLNHPSLQGDAILSDVFTFFGIKTEYIPDGVKLSKAHIKDEHFGFNFSDCPDIVQTIAVTAAAMGVPAFFNGLQTLKIKETDRVEALKVELSKLGTQVEVEGHTMKLTPSEKLSDPGMIHTYEDHRMAMSFAALAMKLDHIDIEEPDVVRKSYPAFWDDLKRMGFVIKDV
jgi:3-phosphoshikimate 1-carboxyvinyltransferase